MSSKVLWNDQLRLVLSDVDETVADLYRPAEPRMLAALSRLLEQRIALVLITGQSVANVEERVVMRLPAPLRQQIAVGACSGAELWGYSPTGRRDERPIYTAESTLTEKHKADWRAVIAQLVEEFRLLPVAPIPIADFKRQFGDEPWRVMLDDRGPQITFEFPSAWQLSAAASQQVSDRLGVALEGGDLRVPIAQRAQQLLEAHGYPGDGENGRHVRARFRDRRNRQVARGGGSPRSLPCSAAWDWEPRCLAPMRSKSGAIVSQAAPAPIG